MILAEGRVLIAAPPHPCEKADLGHKPWSPFNLTIYQSLNPPRQGWGEDFIWESGEGAPGKSAGGSQVGRVTLPWSREEPSGTDTSPGSGESAAHPSTNGKRVGAEGDLDGTPGLCGSSSFLRSLSETIGRKDHFGEFRAGKENTGFSPVPCRVQEGI